MAISTGLEATIDKVSSEEQLASIEKQTQLSSIQERQKTEELAQLNDWNTARITLNQLDQYWRTEEARTESNRATRDIDISVEALRDSGEIDQDETFIPVRVIDGNIVKEIPPFINFLKASNRIAIFKDPLDPTFDTSLLEQSFTQGMTYPGWIKPFYKIVDGSATHGWASAEVVFDDTKPLKCGIEYIAHEDLMFYRDAKDLNALGCIVRRYRVTANQLKKWVDTFGFDPIQVSQLLDQINNNASDRDKTIQVFKRYCKYNGVVYSAFFSLDGNVNDWLKKPEIHYCGIDTQETEIQNIPTPTPVPSVDPLSGQVVMTTQMVPTPTPVPVWKQKPLQSYPFFILPYRETEKPLLFDYIGRVFLDRNKQEAQTSMVTSYVNGLSRSMQIYGSPMADNVQDGRQAKQLPIALSNGTFMDKPFNFWGPPSPNPEVLKGIQYMDTSNAAEVGQTNFAVNNRPDSRKTATEIQAAEKDNNLLNSVDLTLFSEFIRSIMGFCWLICQSQALQNRIKFLLIKPQQAPNDSDIDAFGTFQEEQSLTNDTDTIERLYDVRAAGDVDVVAKEDTLNKMQSDWPVVANTPLAGRFLADYMKLKYPQDGALYSSILLNGDPKVQIIQALGSALQGIVNDPHIAHLLTPEDKMNLQKLQQETMQVLQPQQQQAQQAPAQPQQPKMQQPQKPITPQ